MESLSSQILFLSTVSFKPHNNNGHQHIKSYPPSTSPWRRAKKGVSLLRQDNSLQGISPHEECQQGLNIFRPFESSNLSSGPDPKKLRVETITTSTIDSSRTLPVLTTQRSYLQGIYIFKISFCSSSHEGSPQIPLPRTQSSDFQSRPSSGGQFSSQTSNTSKIGLKNSSALANPPKPSDIGPLISPPSLIFL
jgi:hypothetical protein